MVCYFMFGVIFFMYCASTNELLNTGKSLGCCQPDDGRQTGTSKAIQLKFLHGHD